MGPRDVEVLFRTKLSQDGTLKDVMETKDYKTPDDIVSDLCRLIGVEFVSDIPVSDIPGYLVSDININYAKAKKVIPLSEDDSFITVLLSNPLDTQILGDLRLIFGKPIRFKMSTAQKIEEAINRVYEKNTSNFAGLEDLGEEDTDLDNQVIDLLDAEDDAPVIKLVNSILFRAVKEKASDIHIQPNEKHIAVRFRIDGVLYSVFKPPKKLQNAITSRIKVMANLNIAEKRLPQDGRIPLKLAGKDIDVRLSTVPTAFGESIVMRIQDRSSLILDIAGLGFSKKSLEEIYKSLQKTYGIVLVTGPTGSGKSTTLYSCLQKINTIDRNILTVENPVEQRIPGIGQIQVNSKIGLTFASGLRAILRQDPNVVMIGEIRDLETAEIAINASLTGHLVLSTIHTNDSAGVFPRLTDMGCEPFLVATSLLGVIAQRLIRLLCVHCKAPHTPTNFELESLGLTPEQAAEFNFMKPVGCEQCNQKGYGGRTIIEEFLLLTDEIRTLIMKRADGNTMKKAAIAGGMIPFREHGIQKAKAGITSIEEVLSNTQADG